MLISDVISVIQDLPRSRQVAILDQLYDKLDTRLKQTQLSIFGRNDQDLLKFVDRVQFEAQSEYEVYQIKNRRHLKKVTRLSMLFSAIDAGYDLRQYSLQLPLQQVVDNYRYNQTDLTRDALSYKLVADVDNILPTLTDLGDSQLVLNIFELAIAADNLAVTEQVLAYFDTLDIGEVEAINASIIYDLVWSLTDNDVSRSILTWYKDHREDEIGMDIVQSMIIDVDRSMPLLGMIGEKIEDYVSFIAWEHFSLFPEFVKNLLEHGDKINMSDVMSELAGDSGGEKVMNEIANNQV